MASILGATYPELFAAIGVHSGLEYRAATNVINGLRAMYRGGPDPTKQGQGLIRPWVLLHALSPSLFFTVPVITMSIPQTVIRWYSNGYIQIIWPPRESTLPDLTSHLLRRNARYEESVHTRCTCGRIPVGGKCRNTGK